MGVMWGLWRRGPVTWGLGGSPALAPEGSFPFLISVYLAMRGCPAGPPSVLSLPALPQRDPADWDSSTWRSAGESKVLQKILFFDRCHYKCNPCSTSGTQGC